MKLSKVGKKQQPTCLAKLNCNYFGIDALVLAVPAVDIISNQLPLHSQAGLIKLVYSLYKLYKL